MLWQQRRAVGACLVLQGTLVIVCSALATLDPGAAQLWLAEPHARTDTLR